MKRTLRQAAIAFVSRISQRRPAAGFALHTSMWFYWYWPDFAEAASPIVSTTLQTLHFAQEQTPLLRLLLWSTAKGDRVETVPVNNVNLHVACSWLRGECIRWADLVQGI